MNEFVPKMTLPESTYRIKLSGLLLPFGTKTSQFFSFKIRIVFLSSKLLGVSDSFYKLKNDNAK